MTVSAACATTVCFPRYRFTGKERDAESGNDYFGARYYNPTTGRFLSEDPLGFLGSGPNLYEYAGDNPINFNDPLGLEAQICSSFLPSPHTYLCVNGDCGGFYPINHRPIGPGTVGPPSDSQKKASCGKVPPPKNPQCFDQCVKQHIDNKGPTGTIYNFLANNCGQWAEDVITQCRAQCSQ